MMPVVRDILFTRCVPAELLGSVQSVDLHRAEASFRSHVRHMRGRQVYEESCFARAVGTVVPARGA